jgi:hypothetical protein
MNEIQLKREKVKKWLTIGLIALAGLIVSPIIFLAIKGLIGLAIAAVTGLAIVTFTPWISMKFANWKVKAIAHEAAQNPIETLTNLLMAKRQAWNEFKENVETAVAARATFKTKTEEFARRYPSRAPEFQAQLQNMTDLVERKKSALMEAKKSIELGEHKLEEMKAYWEMSQIAQAANAAAGMDTGDLYEKLKADTACDAVFESVNKAFAELEVEAALQITNQPADVIEMEPIRQKVRA